MPTLLDKNGGQAIENTRVKWTGHNPVGYGTTQKFSRDLVCPTGLKCPFVRAKQFPKLSN
jgi:hypothetical protein